jgi:hypothetical protein
MDYTVEIVLSEYQHMVRHGLVIVPIVSIFPNYSKENVETILNKSKNENINTMHKVSYANPLTSEQIKIVLASGVKCFNTLTGYNIENTIKYYGGFGICYGALNIKLNKHVDDSILTINMCIENTSIGSEVVFEIYNKYRKTTRNYIVDIPEGYAIIHPGNIPHCTRSIETGSRKNVVLWFK